MNIRKEYKTVLNNIFLILIILIFLFLKFNYFGLIHFNFDEAWFFSWNPFTAKGSYNFEGHAINYTGFHKGPFYQLLLALPYPLTNNFELQFIIKIIFDAISIFFLYKIGCFIDKKVGIIASSLYAFSSYFFIQTSRVVDPNYNLFFSTIFFYSILKISQNKPKYFFTSILSMVFGIQLHPNAFPLILMTIICIRPVKYTPVAAARTR